jgi:hypothetical protein
VICRRPGTGDQEADEYVACRIFFAFFLFWKIIKNTKFVKPEQADLWTGKAAIDAEVWPEPEPKNVLEKVRRAASWKPVGLADARRYGRDWCSYELVLISLKMS